MKHRSAWETAIAEHGKRAAPGEACGAILEGDRGRLEAVPLRNVHEQPERCFRMDGEEWVRLVAGGKVRGYYHSHPEGAAEFSPADIAFAEECALPCYLYHVPSDELLAYSPTGWAPPLIGRPYMAGVNDCFSLVRDWHRQETGIELQMPPRTSEMMVRGLPNLLEVVEANSLVRVTGSPRRGDIILMHLRPRRPVPNHCAVHLGDGTILHQLLLEPSGRVPWGGYWEQVTAAILRHSSLMPRKAVAAGTEPDKMEPGEKMSPAGDADRVAEALEPTADPEPPAES